MSITVINADSIQHLLKMEPNSIDACVTDPPYGLGSISHKDVMECMKAWAAEEEWTPKGTGFMGKAWDRWVPPPSMWAALLRVIKPGGHALVFAGSRTVDLMGISLRLGGWEVRDSLQWLYGSGFPKSHSVSIALDKLVGAEREIIGRGVSGISGSDGVSVGGSSVEFDLTAPSSPLAIEYDGVGTALKPAFEPILLVRKPIDGTIAENVTQWGTGGLNVRACRIGTEMITTNGHGATSMMRGLSGATPVETNRDFQGETHIGRWPANVMLDENAAAEIGEVSRYFYCAKAGKSEREAGLDGFVTKTAAELTGREPDSAGVKHGRASMTGEPRSNIHPTVKPVSLMRWLAKLICPKNGTIIDPFLGSGTTGIGADLEGFSFVGIEREAEYAEIARSRIAHWSLKHVDGMSPEEKERMNVTRNGQRRLF